MRARADHVNDIAAAANLLLLPMLPMLLPMLLRSRPFSHTTRRERRLINFCGSHCCCCCWLAQLARCSHEYRRRRRDNLRETVSCLPARLPACTRYSRLISRRARSLAQNGNAPARLYLRSSLPQKPICGNVRAREPIQLVSLVSSKANSCQVFLWHVRACLRAGCDAMRFCGPRCHVGCALRARVKLEHSIACTQIDLFVALRAVLCCGVLGGQVEANSTAHNVCCDGSSACVRACVHEKPLCESTTQK